MKLILVYNPNCYGWKERYDLLVESAKKFDLDVEGISFYDFDDEDRISIVNAERHFILPVGYPNKEKLYKIFNDKSILLQDGLFDCFSGDLNTDLYLDFLGLPHIKTISRSLYKNFNMSLDEIVDYLGGFPIVLKRSGLSKGEGVFKVDDISQLKSMVDLFDIENYGYLFKEFYPHTAQGRVITVGKKFIAGHLNIVGEDFRSNVGENSNRVRENHVFDSNVLDYVSKADADLVANFSGYDVLYGVDGSHKICEKNSPCNFTMTQLMTGVSISDEIIKFLLQKV